MVILVAGLVIAVAAAAYIFSVFKQTGNSQNSVNDINYPAVSITDVSGSDDVDTIEAELNSSDIEGVDKELPTALQEAGY